MLVDEYIHPRSETLEQLFSSNRFSIPDYQRSYNWDGELVRDLLADIYYAVEQEDSCYFLGAVILSDNTGELKEEVLEVVDGQQRIVTLSLVILAIIHFIKEQKSFPNSDRIDMVVSTLYKLLIDVPIFDANSQSIIPRLKLNNKKDSQFYERMLIFQGEREFKVLEKEAKTDITRRLLDTYKMVMGFLKEYYAINEEVSEPSNKLLQFINFILKHMVVTTIITNEEQIDAYEVFEVLNGRRLELTQIDLIKNYFLRKAGSQKTGELFNYVRDQWNKLDEQFRLRNKEKHIKHCMETYFLARFGFFPLKKLYRKVRDETEGQLNRGGTGEDEVASKIKQYLQDFNKNGGVNWYLKIQSNTLLGEAFPDTTEKYIRYLQGFKITYPSLLIPLLRREWEPETIDQYYQLLYYVMLRMCSTMSPVPFNRLHPLFADLAHEIDRGKLKTLKKAKEYIVTKFNKQYPQMMDDARFVELFKSLMTKSKDAQKILLAMLDDGQGINPSGLECVNILPLEANLHQWKYFDTEQRNLYKERLANYTLLEKDLVGKSMDKLPYEQKVVSYSQSQIPMTKSLNSKFHVWSEHSIKSRQEDMANEACKLWSLSKIEV